MRIEVLIGSEDPIIFPLKSNKVTIGSGESCEIILSASGISRKHLTVITEDDHYYVVDQGSTNGTFINEERLIPGKRVEFTSFFPVRLGDNVLVSLLSDEEGTLSSFEFSSKKEPTNSGMKLPERSDSTTVINLKDLKKARTEELVLERNQKRETRKKSQTIKAPPPQTKKKVNLVAWLCGIIVLAAGYYNFYVLDTTPEKVEYREVGKIITAPQTPQNVVPDVNENLVAKDLLPTKEYVTGLLGSIKCAIDIEIYLCKVVPNANGTYGAVQVGLAVHVLVDGTPYIEEAKKFVKDKEDKALVRKTAAYIFLMRYLPPLDENILGESRLIIGLFLKGENGPFADTVIALKPKVFNEHKNSFGEDKLRRIRELGHAALMPMESFYTVL